MHMKKNIKSLRKKDIKRRQKFVVYWKKKQFEL